MSTPRLTDDELALLTDEERQGYLEEINENMNLGDEAGGEGDDDDDGSGDEAGAEAAAAGEDQDNSGEEDAAAAAAAAKAEADQEAAAAANASPALAVEEPAPAAAVAEEEPQERTPAWILPADLPERLKAIEDKKDELVALFDDGQLTGGELRAQTRDLDKQADEIKSRQIRGEMARDIAVDTWVTRDVPDFMKAHPEYAKSDLLRNALDAEVRKLQTTAVNPLSPKLLAKAHEAISAQIPGAFGEKATPKENPTDPPKAADTGKKQPAKRDAPPPTLAHVPAADPTETDDGGEFAHLDRALAKNDSLGYEKALAALSEEKRNQYLAQ